MITAMKNLLISILIILIYPASAVAQHVIPLYEGKAPGSESWTWKEATFKNDAFNIDIVYNVSAPSLTAFLPEKGHGNGSAIIVAPGGAFHILSIESEGYAVARWLNSKGIAAFVLKYRLVKSETENPLTELIPLMSDYNRLDSINAPVVKMATRDGLEAVKYVQEHADDYGIEPDRIGIMGFSAGATLSLSVVQTATDENRPNFVAPIYPYKRAVLGDEIPESRIPIFVAAASDDELGLALHSVEIYTEWLHAGQPAELHMYEKGGHGFGMQKKNTPSDHWILDFENWLKFQKLIPQ
jgi:acetyl esterase/lipase